METIMENLLQIMIVTFMGFLCTLCLFAVVVIARDIVHENADIRRERMKMKSEALSEKSTSNAVAPKAAEEQTAEIKEEDATPCDAHDEADEPQSPEPDEALAEASEAEELTRASDESEETDGTVSFNRAYLTLEEKYLTLSSELKRFFDDIAKYATAKEGVKEFRHTNCYDYKIGAYRVLRMTIKRNEIICEFKFIDTDLDQYVTESNVKIRQSATQVRVSEASAVGAVKDGVDLMCRQVEADKERKRELARARRRERRRLAKEEAVAKGEQEA